MIKIFQAISVYLFVHFVTLFTHIQFCLAGFSKQYRITVRTGNTAILPCQLNEPTSESTPYVIEWSRNDDVLPIFIKIGRYPVRINSHFKGKQQIP